VCDAEFWRQFWPQLWSGLVAGIVSGVVTGVVFTLGWGLVSGRRDALRRQIELVSSWAEEFTSATIAWLQLLTLLVVMADEIENGMNDEERRDLLSECRVAKGRVEGAVTRIVHVANTVEVFDSDEIEARIRALLESARRVNTELLEIEPRTREEAAEPKRVERLKDVRKTVRAAILSGHELVTLMQRETSLDRIASYYRHYLRRHYNSD